jgi:hypothetical protein
MRFMRITTVGMGLAAAAGLGMGGAALAQAKEMPTGSPSPGAHSESQVPDRIVTPGRNTAVRIMWSPAATQRSHP